MSNLNLWNELDKLNDAKYNDGKRKAINNEIAAIEKRKKELLSLKFVTFFYYKNEPHNGVRSQIY